MKLLSSVFLLIALVSFNACAPKVTRVDANEVIDLSGKWNDTDSRLTSEEMIKSSLSETWLRRFREKYERQPVVIVGGVINKSYEHIDATTFIKDLEREYVKSGLVRVVQNDELREKIRTERGDQQDNADPATAKQFGKELGADFMLFGNISSIYDTDGKTKLIFFQVNLEFADMETNELVWIGDKKIKKVRK